MGESGRGRGGGSPQGQKKNPFILLTPGPVPLSPASREILSREADYHRSLRFQEILKDIRPRLQRFFQTKEPVIVLSGSGTAAMEAAIANTLSPGDRALCVCAGKFGERWRDISLSFGIKAQPLNVPWGEAVSPETVRSALKSSPGAKAFLISACETSSGAMHPIREISLILKDCPDVLFMLDGSTGLGAMDLPMDKWGVDVLVGGSQKGFGLPAGLAFIALSEKAWRAGRTSRCPKYYFDLEREKAAQKKGWTAFSASVSLFQALQESLKAMEAAGGLSASIDRRRRLSGAARAFCGEMGLKLFSRAPAPSVTAVQMPDGISAEAVREAMEQRHKVIVAGGQGPLKGKIVRIGHLGPVADKSLLAGLKALGESLRLQNPGAFKKGKIQKALDQAELALKAGS